jgi:ADP-heptose:LPS heptosyltransferase
MLLGGRETAGFYRPGAYCPDPERFVPYPDGLREVERHLKLVEHLGIERHGSHKDLPVYNADRSALAEIVPGEALANPYVVVHPGASVPERQWPPQRFAAVADALARDGCRIVLTGSLAEAAVTTAVRQAMHAPAVDLTGRTTLGTLGALLAGAALLVSNDTGVMHVGEAVEAPLVAVSFDPEAWRWAPQDTQRFRMLTGGAAVPVDAVLEAARQQLCRRTDGLAAARPPAGRTPDDPGVRPARG